MHRRSAAAKAPVRAGRIATIARLLLRQLLTTLLVMTMAVLVTFVVARALPGDPASHLLTGMAATPEGIAAMRERMGLDLSVPRQAALYVRNVSHGNLGASFVTGEPVSEALRVRLPATLTLTLAAFVIALAIALPLGIAAAARPRQWPDRLCRLVASASASLPTFLLGLLLIYVFYFRLGWAPEPAGQLDPFGIAPPARTHFMLIDAFLAHDPAALWDGMRHLALPALAMAGFGVPPLARVVRTALGSALTSDPVRTARSFGVRPWRIYLYYAGANAAPAVLTTAGLVLCYLLGANVAIEKIFAWPGIGAYALDALDAADYAPLQGYILCVAFVFSIVTAIVDALLLWTDPRRRYGGESASASEWTTRSKRYFNDLIHRLGSYFRQRR